MENIETLYEDVNRRINRLYKSIEYCQVTGKKIIFIASSKKFKDNTVINKANNMTQLLSEKFTKLNFTLVIMHHIKDFNEANSEKCMFIYLENEGTSQESYAEWGQKLRAAGIVNEQEEIDPMSTDHPF